MSFFLDKLFIKIIKFKWLLDIKRDTGLQKAEDRTWLVVGFAWYQFSTSGTECLFFSHAKFKLTQTIKLTETEIDSSTSNVFFQKI